MLKNKMSNYMPHPVEGHVVPGLIDRTLRYDFTTNNHMQPIKKELYSKVAPQKPKNLGDERHKQLIDAIKGLSVSQKVNQSQIQEALPQPRDWRN